MKKTAKNLCDPDVLKTETPLRASSGTSDTSDEERRPSASSRGMGRSLPPSSSKKVLMMVDEGEADASTRSLQEGLRRGEIDVEACADVRQALQRFRESDYDLVLLDLQTQVLDGFTVCRELKRIRDDARIGFLTTFPIYKSEFDRLFPDVSVDLFYTRSMPTSALAASIRGDIERRRRGPQAPPSSRRSTPVGAGLRVHGEAPGPSLDYSMT